MLRAIVGLLALCASVAWAGPDWGSKDWSCRAKVVANAGAADHQDQAVEQDVDFASLLKQAGVAGSLDPNSPRVALLKAGQEQEVPSRFFPDKDNAAKGRLCWLRAGVMSAGTEETYYVYFDAGTGKPAKACPELAKFTPQLGKNLLQNGDMNAADPADATHAAVWEYEAVQQSGTVEFVKGAGRTGGCALRIANKAGGETEVGARQQVAVEANKRYVLCGWVKAEKGAKDGAACVTAWFGGVDGAAVTGPDGDYSNYKTQLGAGLRGETPWTLYSSTSINVYDPKTKTNHPTDNEKTLPGTGAASVALAYYYGTGSALFDDIEFRECPAGAPIVVSVAGVEKRP